MHKYWQHKGHEYGLCLVSPDQQLKYVNIPKCASSATKQALEAANWHYGVYHDNPVIAKAHSIIVLRDPIERWLSGICEYFTLYHSSIDVSMFNPAFFDLIIEQTTVDDHTEKQVYFIDALDINNCTFFKCDSEYSINLAKFLHDRACQVPTMTQVHVTNDSEIRSKFKKIFQPLLENPKYLTRIIQHYAQDYQLINSVTFYGSR